MTGELRVAVVGAGFAGLAAADALIASGIEVVVLEARDRVGGRVWSRELGNGAVVEMGAEFILPGNDSMLAIVERFGLGLWDKGMLYGDREPRGGRGLAAGAMHTALELIGEALADVAAGTSAAALLDGLPLDPGASEAIRARLEVSAAATADRVAASALAGLAAHSDDICPSVAGGNQRVAHALAAGLGSALHLGSPVERIAWTEDGAVVSAAAAEITVDRVVLAVPASVVDRIAFDPPLPGQLRAAYDAVGYGNAAKLFVPLAGERGRAPSCPCPSGTGPGRRRARKGYRPSSALSPDPRRRSSGWVCRRDRRRGSHRSRGFGPTSLSCSTTPCSWSGTTIPGSRPPYSCEAPGSSAFAPVGPFHACGEHTCDGNAALMDGALASGQRVAAEILGTR